MDRPTENPASNSVTVLLRSNVLLVTMEIKSTSRCIAKDICRLSLMWEAPTPLSDDKDVVSVSNGVHLNLVHKVGSTCLCGLVVRVLGYRSGGPGSIPGTTRFSGKKKTVVGLERGPLSVVSTTEELLDRKVAAPV
jgi:hypothetical protein